MGQIVTQALSLVLVVFIGYGIKRLGWVRQEHFSFMAIIVLRVTLPCALITSFNSFTITGSLGWIILFGFLVNLVQQLYTRLTTGRRSNQERAFALLHSGSYNIGAFAMPYTAQFVGPQAVLYTALFDIGNSISAGGIGYAWGMSTAKGRTGAPGEKAPRRWATLVSFVAQMFRSPVFDTYLVLLVLRAADLTLPAPVISFTSLVGAANPFAAMLMIGIGLEVILPKETWLKAARFLLRRYAFVVALSALVWWVLPGAVFPHDVKVVLMMVLWAPVAAMISGFVDEAGGDVELSTLMTSVTIIIGIVMIPTVYGLLA